MATVLAIEKRLPAGQVRHRPADLPGAWVDRARDVKYLRNMQRSATPSFGTHVRALREARAAEDSRFSLRQVAARCGVTPAYLSRLERDEIPPPGAEVLVKLAHELREDPDVMLAMGGKISDDLRAAILARPRLFADLIRALRDTPEHAVLRILREVRDGDW
jgi:HTH-type transcriptional regulator, competence development regulator